MKPLILKMTAFGPYAGNEVIDFTKIHENSLFLVTGPTGAGKTTIFDAISYALFGETSGNQRSGDALRSDFADVDLLTTVVFEFSLRGRRYEIERTPKQTRVKARGDGVTLQNSHATLKTDDGKKPIVGVSKVNDAVKDLVGLSPEQFRQIMMIPQGQFQKFILAGSEERGKILKTLFDTGFFWRVQEKLREEANALRGSIQDEMIRRDEKLRWIKRTTIDENDPFSFSDERPLEVVVAHVEKWIEMDLKQAQELSQTMMDLNKEKEQLIVRKEKAAAHNAKLEELLIEQKKHQALMQQQETIEQLEKRIAHAQKVEVLLPLEEQCEQLQLKERHAEDQAGRIEQELANHRVIYDEIKDKHQRLHSLEHQAEINRLREEVTNLQRHEKQWGQYMDLKAQWDSLEQKKDALGIQLAERLEKQETMRSQLLELESKLERKHHVEKEIQELKLAELNLEARIKQMINLWRLMERYEKLQKEETHLNVTLEELQLKIEMYEKELREAQFQNMQLDAARLAEGLNNGEPCPVCGSKDHPERAVFPQHVISTKELESLKETFDAEKNKMLELKVRLETKKNEQMQLKSEIDEGLQDSDIQAESHGKLPSADEVKNEGRSLRTQQNELADRRMKCDAELKELAKIQTDVQEHRQSTESLNDVLEEKKAQIQAIRQEQIANETSIHIIESEVPETLLKAKGVGAERQRVQDLLNRLLRDLDAVAEAWQKVQLDQQALESDYKNQQNNVLQLKHELETATEKWQRKREIMDLLDDIPYLQGKGDVSNLAPFKQQVRDYQQERTITESRMQELKDQVGKEPHKDIGAIEGLLELLTDRINDFAQKLSQHETAAKDNRKILNEVIEMSAGIRDIEKQYGVLGKLARVANGNNSMKMSFERYVLASFLEDILKAANVRLLKMTDHRYVLRRSENVADKRVAGGLDLNVHDHYTGIERHINTLSGGESFKASLAMALGLSDVVQSYAGGVGLDTMFIDEGFGTLDAESLDQAIECLVEIQKTGRLVGIISHVGELKERIKTKLEIIPSNTGSRTNNFG